VHDFRAIGGRLRELLGPAALRIDHIGSTAVDGLAAKDIIDVQVTVASFDEAMLDALDRAGFVRWPEFAGDHCPPGMRLAESELEKRFFNAPPSERKANIHVRVEGRFNQRYALLCRDYLRSHPLAASAYSQVKRALARIVGDDLDAFYDVKDPVFDILMAGAEEWARATGWRPGASDA
jgi:GrpB-like predicted nucleotidyltransferase (UPF0157 family)